MTRTVSNWKLDRGRNSLACTVSVDGTPYTVHFPIGEVSRAYAEEVSGCGCGHCLEEVGYVDILATGESVDGWLSKVRKIHRRVGKARGKIIGKRWNRRLTQFETRAGRIAKRVARDKRVGGALGTAAVAFPAVGAPALAAWTAANRGVSYYDAAKRAQKARTRGAGPPNYSQLLQRGRRAQQIFQAANRSGTPQDRMLIQALRMLG